MIKREKYISQIRGFYDSDLIKIITGIRRCGKSVILQDIAKEVSQKTDNIIFLDFDNAANLVSMPDCMSLLKYIEEHRKNDSLCYVFLDEVQRVDGWADACRTLRISNCSVFVSGSNSKLLSREFTKELTGRYVSFRIKPFVYKELLEYSEQLNKKMTTSDYIIWGGFPKRIEFNSLDEQKSYLNELNESIIINDIISRYKIRKVEEFKRIVNYVLVSNARIFSAQSVADYVKANGLTCTVSTVIKYLGYLEEAFVIETIKQYSKKTKRELSYYQKVYNEDVSFNSIRALDNRYDLTHNFENVIYNELIYMGYSLQVFNNNGREIDFRAFKDGKIYLIQVAYSVVDEKAYNREFSAFSNIDNSNQKIIITNDDIDYSTSTVKHIQFKDFVMMDEL